MYHLYAIADECGDNAGNHPRGRKHANEQENADGYSAFAYFLGNAFFYRAPLYVAYPHAQGYAHAAGGEQDYLRGASQRVAPEDNERAREQGDEGDERYGAEPRRGFAWLTG